MPKISKRKQAKQLQDMTASADRKRKIVKDKIFPLLKDAEGSVRYIKIMLHTASVAVEQAFNNKRQTTKVSDLDLLSMFDAKDKRTKIYVDLFKMLADEDINSFQAMIRDLPDNLDRYFFNEGEAKQFNEVDIDKILG
jgi:hypothetical protein